MNGDRASVEPKETRITGILVLLVAIVIAFASARPYAGGWNDGSRLASVESLVDQHTWAIDRSIFVEPWAFEFAAGRTPYSDDSGMMEVGTGDKMKVGDHFYSDKPPVPSLFLAGWYYLLKWSTGRRARGGLCLFCYWRTVASSGLAYVVAAWAIYRLGLVLQLSLVLRILLTASFALATVALPYTRHANNHIWMLGIA